MAKIFKLLVLVPIAVVILAFSIANRQTISVSFDPFSDPGASGASVTARLFVLLFLALIFGVILGGIATWFAQGTNRRRARDARDEAQHWRDEVQRLRAQPQIVAPAGRSAGGVLVRSDS